MPTRGLLLVLLCVALLAIGQLLFKLSAAQWRVEGWSLATAANLISPIFLLAVGLYGVATVLWIFALRSVPLTTAFPLYALTFVIVPILAHFFVGEPLSARTMVGAAIIVAGIAVSVT